MELPVVASWAKADGASVSVARIAAEAKAEFKMEGRVRRVLKVIGRPGASRWLFMDVILIDDVVLMDIEDYFLVNGKLLTLIVIPEIGQSQGQLFFTALHCVTKAQEMTLAERNISQFTVTATYTPLIADASDLIYNLNLRYNNRVCAVSS